MPKQYLSYSQMRLWLEDKEKYRDRYYREHEERQTAALMFGSEIAKGLESGKVELSQLPVYPVKEYQIKIDINGVPFFAYIDTFDPTRRKFREYKTGQNKQGGLPRWTQKDVDNHMQLDVYSTLIQEQLGSVDEECHLDWLEVKHKIKEIEFDGMILKSESNELELTGKVTSFARIITQTERDRMKFLIRSVAEEISSDYAEFLKSEEAYVN